MGLSNFTFNLTKYQLVRSDLIQAVFRQRPEWIEPGIRPGFFHNGRFSSAIG